jgi:hypothetical protein
MRDHNLAAIHDRIDEEHFEVRMHDQAISALQERVNLLEAAVRELREVVFYEQTDRAHRKMSDPELSSVRDSAPRARRNGKHHSAPKTHQGSTRTDEIG